MSTISCPIIINLRTCHNMSSRLRLKWNVRNFLRLNGYWNNIDWYSMGKEMAIECITRVVELEGQLYIIDVVYEVYDEIIAYFKDNKLHRLGSSVSFILQSVLYEDVI